MHDVPREGFADAWDQACAELRASLPPSTFDLWLEPLEPVSVRGSTLYVSAPRSVRTWAERRYLPRLASAVRRYAPEVRNVRLVEEARDTEKDELRDPPLSARPFHADRSFDRFVIGTGNRLAHAAALAVAELPGEAYNPLFLHGAPGLGKTHLLGAIGLYLQRHRPDLTVHYTTAERFTAEFVAALRASGAERFKARYRELDVLLIDDVQFLEGKAHTEEEFFHTFNALYETGGQIVLSCDRPPAALSKLAERLRDRFEWGLRVGLEPPDLPTRVALLDHLVARAGAADAPAPDVLREIARRVPTNFRRLEGALVRITALASISDTAPTPELVRSVFEQHPSADAPLGPPGSPQAREPTVTDVQEAVCAVLHLSSDELLSTRRTPRIVRARQLAMYLARDLTGLSLSRIGSSFGRDHTTVYHAIQKVSASLEPGSDLHSDLDQAKALLAQAHRRATP